MKAPAAIDFETRAIGPRPGHYPPVPVGVAVKIPGHNARYYAWGHPAKNNCTRQQAVARLCNIYAQHPILCHGAQFDLEVAHAHLGLPLRPRHGFHDTLLLAFLFNPNMPRIGLKDLANDLLGIAPTEQTELRDWIHEHVPGTKRKKKEWAASLSLAPGDIVGKYAVGDVIRTQHLYKHMLTKSAAYTRERELLPILIEMSRRGIPVDMSLLAQEIEATEASVQRVDAWLHRKLGASVNLDSNEDVCDAMERRGLLTEWVLTRKGARSIATENLRMTDCEPAFIGALELRSMLTWNLRTHLHPWYEQASFTGGTIHCSWNQVRQANERQYGRAFGARTGRLSSNPNLQNVTQRILQLVSSPAPDCLLVPRSLVDCHVPDPRRVIAAPRGQRLLGADYSGQELRLLAHFVGGDLKARYLRDPHFDLHGHVQHDIHETTGTLLRRTPTKNVVFGRIYGAGVAKTAQQIGIDHKTTRKIRAGLDHAIPGLAEHDHALRLAGKCVTWGGRVNPVEPPQEFENGDERTFDYKLLNTEIQGSAADVTKEAMIRCDAEKISLLLSAHDELLAVAPTGESKRALKTMQACMESIEMDGIKMLTEGAVGRTWRDCK